MAGNVMPERLDSLGINETAVIFGQNLIAESIGGRINVEDTIEVIDAW